MPQEQTKDEILTIFDKMCTGSIETCPLNKGPQTRSIMWQLTRDSIKNLGSRWSVNLIAERMRPIRAECEKINCPYLKSFEQVQNGIKVSCNRCGLLVATTECADPEALDALETLASLGPCPNCQSFSLVAYPISGNKNVIKLNVFQFLVQREGHSPGLVTLSRTGHAYCLCPEWRFQRIPPKERECAHLKVYYSESK